jgi:hypothetical protein
VAQKLGDAGIIHTIQEQAHVAGGHLKSAANEASRAVTGKALVVETPKPKKRGLLIIGVITAAVAAGVAAWKASKPVEDPWKTPAPVTPSPSTPAATTPAASATGVGSAASTPAPVPAAPAGSSAPASADTPLDAAFALAAEDEADTSADASADKAKHVADDADSSAGEAATDEKTAVKNTPSDYDTGADNTA